MKILLVGHSDSGGGAAIAARRLCRALRSAGIEADLGVARRDSREAGSFELPRPKGFARKVERRLARAREDLLMRRFRSSNAIQHSLNLYSRIDVDWINDSDYDIVHLHWVNDDTLSIRDIAKITKPIVWTLHDSWLFCGAEHYSNVFDEDLRFVDGYESGKPDWLVGLDVPRLGYRRKLWYWSGTQVLAVCPSSWEAEQLERSALYRRFGAWTHRVIPNAIDGTDFYPMDKAAAKRALGLDPAETIIGFGAAYGISTNPHPKGGHLLAKALEQFRRMNGGRKARLLVYGPAGPDFLNALPVEALSTGPIGDERLMNLVYNCFDAFLCPSMIENLPYSCLEAMACGVPVAAFRVGGIPDIVLQSETGYLASPFDTEELSRGLLYCLENNRRLGQAGAKRARNVFAPAAVASAHLSAYEAALVGGARVRE